MNRAGQGCQLRELLRGHCGEFSSQKACPHLHAGDAESKPHSSILKINGRPEDSFGVLLGHPRNIMRDGQADRPVEGTPPCQLVQQLTWPFFVRMRALTATNLRQAPAETLEGAIPPRRRTTIQRTSLNMKEKKRRASSRQNQRKEIDLEMEPLFLCCPSSERLGRLGQIIAVLDATVACEWKCRVCRLSTSLPQSKQQWSAGLLVVS